MHHRKPIWVLCRPRRETYGKAQKGLAKDPAFQKLLAHIRANAEFAGRSITVGVDL
jgi:hypothetical protein